MRSNLSTGVVDCPSASSSGAGSGGDGSGLFGSATGREGPIDPETGVVFEVS